MLYTKVCQLLEIQHPVICAPLGPDLSGPALASAISNAGGLGMLRAPDEPDSCRVSDLIKQTRELTSRPFAMGFVLHFPYQENLQTALTEGLPVVQVYWGKVEKDLVDLVHSFGAKIIHQVGSIEDARSSASAGVDIIQAQGMEAGGHIIGKVSTMALLPPLVDAVSPTPVIASGGVADGRGLVAALALGAEGVCIGTRFLATLECLAHGEYKARVVTANESDTEYTDLFGRARWAGANHRCLRTPLVDTWQAKRGEVGDETNPSHPQIGRTVIHGKERGGASRLVRFRNWQVTIVISFISVGAFGTTHNVVVKLGEWRQPYIDGDSGNVGQGKVIPLFSGTAPNAYTEGDIGLFPLYAGQSVGLVREILPAGAVVVGMVEGAKAIIRNRLLRLVVDYA